MADANYPEDLLYHPEHDWARFDADDPLLATFGITWFAQDALGEVVYFEPPDVGSRLTKDEPYCEVDEVNTALGETPDAINDDPYGDGWFVKVRLSDADNERSQLLSQADYVASLQ